MTRAPNYTEGIQSMRKSSVQIVLALVLAVLSMRDTLAFTVINFDDHVGMSVTMGVSPTPRGDGSYVNGNLILWLVNAGLEINNFNGKSASNVYLGIGHYGILQAQVGLGSQGAVFKVRSDITLHMIANQTALLPGSKDPLWEHLVFSVAYAHYPGTEGISGVQLGIGLTF